MIRYGQVVEKYIVEDNLGSGGMADVFRVRHSMLGTLHAMKVLHAEGPTLASRLLAEGQVQANLRHPNIVRVTDTVTVEGHPGIVMDHVEGLTLEDHLLRKTFSLADRLAIFDQVLDAMAHAHAMGVVHRDLKPGNVIVAYEDGRPVPKVVDFGLVKVLTDVIRVGGSHRTRSGSPIGTPAYMAPEQIESDPATDHRADVFALGSLLYELVSEKRPFDRPSVAATFTAISGGIYAPLEEVVPDVDRRLSAAVAACLRVDPAERPADVAAVRAILGAPRAAARRTSTGWTGAAELATPERASAGGWPAWALPVGVSVVAALAAFGLILAVASSYPGVRPPSVTSLEAAPEPAEAPAVEAPAAAPPPLAPPPLAPRPLAEVAPPTPAEPRPAPKAAARPAAGGFVASGARSVVLRDSEGRDWRASEPLAPGPYEIRANFGDGYAPAGAVTIGAGTTAKITCDDAWKTCTPG